MPLTADCLERLHLRKQPFGPVTEEAFLYRDTLLDTQIDRLLAALEQPGAIVLLRAENGGGRSTQLMQLIGSLPRHFEIIAFRGQKKTSLASVNATIRKHLRARNVSEADQTLEEIFAARGLAGVDSLIAIDDAFLLGPDSLTEITKLAGPFNIASSRPARLLLVADDGLGRDYRRMLGIENGSRVQVIQLAPFNHEQTAAYLRHRISAAGNPELAAAVTPSISREFHVLSQGLPGPLNQGAEHWLENNFDPDAHPDDESDSADEQDSPAPQEAVQPAADAPEPDSTDQEPEPEPEHIESTQSDETEPEDQQEQADSPKRAWILPAFTGLGLIAVVALIAVKLPGAGDDGQSRSRIAAITRPDTPADELASATAAPPLPTNEQIAPAPTSPEARRETAATNNPDKADENQDLNWLSTQDPAHFTIQLIALKQPEAVRDYLRKYGVEGAHIIPTQPFSVAVIGSFKTMQEARAALADLPAAAVAQGYWIRGIGKIAADVPDNRPATSH